MNTELRTMSLQAQHIREYLSRRLDAPEADSSLSHHFDSLAEEEEFYTYNIIGAILCIAFVALIAGLFLGLLTLDVLDLQIIQRASMDEDEIRYATRLIPICKKRHEVLVTLLIMNALAYEALPIFLDALVPSWGAILLSTTFVMLFGEILPSGIFMGPNQLYLGYKMVPLVRLFLWVFYPLAKPLAMLLDCLTNADTDGTGGTYNRSELSALVRIQHEAGLDHQRRETRLSRVTKDQGSWAAHKAEIMGTVKDSNEDQNIIDEEAPELAHQLMPPLHKREVDLVEGALYMKTVHAMDVYTPFSRVYAVPDKLILDKATITTIYSHGYSRVPVYRANPSDPNDQSAVLGFLITRQLMLIDWDDRRELSTFPLQRPTCVSPRMNLIEIFEVLQRQGPLLTFVCARPDLANKALEAEKSIPVEAGFMGIITLVDIMESILQDRIYDEGDIRDRDRAFATLTRWAATKLQSFMRKSAIRKKQERERASLHEHQDASQSSDSQPSKSTDNESTPLLLNGGIRNAGPYSSH